MTRVRGTSDGFIGPSVSSDWALVLVSVYHNGAWICHFVQVCFISLGLSRALWFIPVVTGKLFGHYKLHAFVHCVPFLRVDGNCKIINMCSDSSGLNLLFLQRWRSFGPLNVIRLREESLIRSSDVFPTAHQSDTTRLKMEMNRGRQQFSSFLKGASGDYIKKGVRLLLPHRAWRNKTGNLNPPSEH